MIVTTADGRQLEVVDGGGDGLPLVFHLGTPSGPVLSDAVVAAATSAGLRVLTYGRPGYGLSTPAPGRGVADCVPDTVAVLDALGLEQFVVLGWSGGGPHALACAALLPDKCLAAATLAGVAPYDADGLDWLAGMGEDNVEEFGAAVQGLDALDRLLTTWSASMGTVTADQVAESFGGLVDDVDRASITGEFAEFCAQMMRKAVSTGVAGWRDDDLAFAVPWGFDLGALEVPVTVWQGGHDLMVPTAHGAWLAEHIVGAGVRLLPDEGHLSMVTTQLPRVLTELRDAAVRA